MPAGQLYSLFPDYRVVTLRQFPNKVVGICRDCGLLHESLIRRWLPIRDVVPHREVKQERILGDNAYVRAQAGEGVFAQRAIVDADDSLFAIMETGDQIGDGGFAGSALPRISVRIPSFRFASTWLASTSEGRVKLLVKEVAPLSTRWLV